MRALKRVSGLAKSQSLLAARHERNQLLLADIEASTLVAIDSQLAWFSGDVALADQLLENWHEITPPPSILFCPSRNNVQHLRVTG